MPNEKVTFSFGANWQDFIHSSLDEERICEAIDSLTGFTGLKSFEALTFLDIGCGSGLFSLAAYKLGADRIESFDLDPLSVNSCKVLREREGNPGNWAVSEGSILDESFLAGIEKADLVYSWGVLHHTGNMWQAVRNAATLVKPGGLFFVSVYNRVDGPFGSLTWLKLKRLYNRSSPFLKKIIEFTFMALIIMKMVITLKNPVSEIRNYKNNRGMSFRTDIRDSLGGYPYEYASAEEIHAYCRREFGFYLENIKTVNSLSLNEFLFRNPG